MNERLETLRKNLEDEIKSAETSLARAARHLTSVTETGLETLEVRLHEALAKAEAGREKAAHAGERIKHYLADTTTHAISRVEDWKTDHEIEKLEKLADKREQQAADAILLAAFALLEAEVAIVEALKARKTAIEVAG
jgi:hypothetical protein